MQFLPEFLTVAVAHLLAVMSPGPDFAMVTRNALVHSRRSGIYSAIGLGLGILVHVIYSLVGIGLIISQSIVLFSAIKLLGAFYLIYIGAKALMSGKKKPIEADLSQEIVTDISARQAIQMGFLTNVLNPKATLFFFSLFSQVISPVTPLWMQTLYGIEMALATMLWFSFVVVVLSQSTFKAQFMRFQQYFEKVFGVILIALGLKIAFSSNK